MSDFTRRGLLAGAAAVTATALASPVRHVSAAEVSTLKPGEAVMLLPTAAQQSEDGRQWVVPLHAWVYVPQDSDRRRRAIAELLKFRHGLDVTPASAPYFDTRVNLLLADNKRDRTIVVDVAGARMSLPPTAANGHAQTLVRVPVSASTPDGARLTIRAVLPASDPRRIETSAHLIGPAGLSIISDIDDTVKVTHVLDRHRMWEATFYKPFEAVDGMPAAYRRLAATGAAFHYVSSSPWHLAEPLLDFLGASGLPLSSIALKQVRLKDRTRLDIVRPGRETKPPLIGAILTKYPGHRFILIGDSGEDDPEVYAEALRRHPAQIARIYIRNVTAARRDDARFARAFAGVEAARWALFEDAGEIGGP
jgi:Phosphatidate phosphatase APP1, catalytic domain